MFVDLNWKDPMPWHFLGATDLFTNVDPIVFQKQVLVYESTLWFELDCVLPKQRTLKWKKKIRFSPAINQYQVNHDFSWSNWRQINLFVNIYLIVWHRSITRAVLYNCSHQRQYNQRNFWWKTKNLIDSIY